MEQQNADLLLFMQHFTATAISLLNTLKTTCETIDTSTLSEQENASVAKLVDAIKRLSDGMRKKDDELDSDNFNYSKFIKKVFYSLRTPEALEFLKNRDSKLFAMKDENNKIVTILPGIDTRIALVFMSDETRENFWKTFYLFAFATFEIIKATNPKKFTKYTAVSDTMTYLDEDIKKSKISLINAVFNPFVGIGASGECSVEQMFAQNTTPSEAEHMTSVLSMMGVEKLIDPEKLKEQLNDISDENVTEATDKIVDMLGAQNNSDVKEVCSTLIKDIVENLKTNGLSNIQETLMSVANNARTKLDVNKMKRTAEGMHSFMENSIGKLSTMTNENGTSPFPNGLPPINMDIFKMLTGLRPKDDKQDL